jgi:hypothetical protein
MGESLSHFGVRWKIGSGIYGFGGCCRGLASGGNRSAAVGC